MATDYYLKIDGIDGESADSKHAKEIDIESFSWGASQIGTGSQAGGSGAGKVSFTDLTFTAQNNKSSVKLMMACATGEHIKKAILTVRKAGKEQHDYYVVTLTDVLVSSYQSEGTTAETSELPTDTFTLNYAKIEFTYKPQKADGSLDAAVVGGYNIKENKKV